MLKGPAKWTCFHLYVILDIFNRHVVGWLPAERERAELAEQLIVMRGSSKRNHAAGVELGDSNAPRPSRCTCTFPAAASISIDALATRAGTTDWGLFLVP